MISEIVIWGAICVVGPFAYIALGGNPAKKSQSKDECKCENYGKDTYEYFMKLTLQEQHDYINSNLDLAEYSWQLCYNDKHQTAKHVADFADRRGKKYTNRYKTY